MYPFDDDPDTAGDTDENGAAPAPTAVRLPPLIPHHV